MEVAQKLKSHTVTLHFKIEELNARFEVLIRFKLIRERDEKDKVKNSFSLAEVALSQIRSLQDKFDKLNFTPFVNTN